MLIFHFWALDSLLCGPVLIFYLLWKTYEISYQLMFFFLTMLAPIYTYIYIYRIGPFPIKDMQTFPPPLRSGQIYMNDAHCAETNEKSVF